MPADTAIAPARSARIAALVITVGALLRVVSFFVSDNSGGDAGAHVSLTAYWLQHPYPKVVFDTYPPGHFWLIAFATLFIRNIATAARVLSLVLGIASLVVVWKLSRRLYGDAAGLLSLAAFTFYSLHIAYSTTSSAEVSYLFFTLLGIACFFAYVAGPGGLGVLVISGLALSVGEAIRYEAWIVFAGLGLILAVLTYGNWCRWLRSVFVFGITGGAWPAFMCSYSWIHFHDPFYIVSQNRLRVMQSLLTVSRSHQLTLTPVVLVLTLNPVLIIAAIWGLARSFDSRIRGAYAALVLFFVSIQAYEVVSGGLLSTARYTITIGTMLAIVAGYGLQPLFEKLLPTYTRFALPGLTVLLLLNLTMLLLLSEVPGRYADEFASVSPRLRYKERVRDVSRYLREHLGPNDAVVIDNLNLESNVIADAAGLPPAPGERAFLAGKKNDIGVQDYIRTEHPRYLVYSDQGTLRESLKLSPGCGSESLEGIRFRCVFTDLDYRVYEMSFE